MCIFVHLCVLLGFLYRTVVNGSNLPLLAGTLRTFQVHACDGNELKIECWPNTVINIYLAQYGRQVPSHQLCPPEGVIDGDLSMLNDTTNCLSSHALRTVEESCREQRICRVQTSPDTFGNDPCPGVRKYAEVAYKCRPNVFSNRVVCEGDRLRLKCERNLRIVIFLASFGATKTGVPECPQPEGEGKIEDCQTSFAREAVMNSCHGRRNCSIPADILTFGQPGCPQGTRLFLKVVHTCVPKDILKDQDLEGNDESHEDGDYNGFIEEPRYVLPATMESFLRTTQPTIKLSTTPKSQIDDNQVIILYVTLSIVIAVLAIIPIVVVFLYIRRSRPTVREDTKNSPKPQIPDTISSCGGGISPFGDDCTELDQFQNSIHDIGVDLVRFGSRSSLKKAQPIDDDDCSFPRAPVKSQSDFFYS